MTMSVTEWDNAIEEAVKNEDTLKIMLYLSSQPDTKKVLYSGVDHLLLCALENSKIEIAKIALDMGANPNLNTLRSTPAIDLAVHLDNLDLLQHMFDKGMDIKNYYMKSMLALSIVDYARVHCSYDVQEWIESKWW